MNLRKISAPHRELKSAVRHLSDDIRSNPGRYEVIFERPQEEFARFMTGGSDQVWLPLESWPFFCADVAMKQLLNYDPEAAQLIVRAIAWRSLCYQEFETRWAEMTWRIPSEGDLAQTLMHSMALGWDELTERLGLLALKLGERALELKSVSDPEHRNPSFCEIHSGSAFPMACCLFSKLSGRASAYNANENLPAAYRPLVEALDNADANAFSDAIVPAAAHHLAMSVPYDGDEIGVVRDYVIPLDAFFPAEIFAAMRMRQGKGLPIEPISDSWLAESHAYFTNLPKFEPEPLYTQVVERLMQVRPNFVYTPPSA